MSVETDKVPQAVWEAKDRRIARESCIRTAAMIYPHVGSNPLVSPVELVVKIARTFEAYIYEDEVPF